MRHHYYHRRSALGVFLRLLAGTAALYLGLTAVSWAFTELLPKALPFLLAALTAAAVVRAVRRRP
jgi:hypothetical protein